MVVAKLARAAALLAVAVALRSFAAEVAPKPLTTLASGKPGPPVVGAYYYPWYRGGREWQNVMRQHLDPAQRPALGTYRSATPEVVAGHIAQSVRAGIQFWAVSWWGPGQICDDNLRNAILAHPDAGKLKYAILYESTGRFGQFDDPHYEHWAADLEYLQQKYFDHPYYLRIDGLPVIFVYLTRVYFRNKGRAALETLRARFPQVYLVGDDVFGPGYRAEWAGNFDAVTAYDVYGQSVGRLGGTQKAVDFLARNYRNAREEANSAGTAFIPTIAPGYNDTAVRSGHPGRARYFSDVETSKEGDLFRAMIRDVALVNLDPSAANLMMVTSFNEWFEDSQIEATSGVDTATDKDDSSSGSHYTGGQRYADYGTLYLDILHEMVTQPDTAAKP